MLKKLLVFACIAFYSSSFAQSNDPDQLSEEVSKKLVESQEYQNVLKYQNFFLDKIANAVNQGTPIQTIKNATLDAIQNNNNQQIYLLLFNDAQDAELFFTESSNAKAAFIQKYQSAGGSPTPPVCSTCPNNLTDEAIYFFSKFDVLNNNRYTYEYVSANNSAGARNASGPTCGSYWNQVKLVVCAGVCGASTAGIGAAACGWGCWCTFCTQNSSVATVICAN